MAYYNDILDAISFIPEVRRETIGMINIIGEGTGLTATTADNLYSLACKVLYCKYIGDFTGVELPVDSSTIGYSGLNEKWLTVIGVEIYRTTTPDIDEIIRFIKADINDSKTILDRWINDPDKSFIDNWQKTPTIKFFPAIDLTPTTTINDFIYSSSTIRMVGYLNFLNVTSCTNAFYNCPNLEVVNIDNLKCNLDLSNLSKLSIDSIEYIIEHAQSVTDKTLTLGSNLSKVTAYYRSIATSKGWTLA